MHADRNKDTFESIGKTLDGLERKVKRLGGGSKDAAPKDAEIRVYLFEGDEDIQLATLPMSYNKAVGHLRKIRRGFRAAEIDQAYDRIELLEERDGD
jgi:hypothetical protein